MKIYVIEDNLIKVEKINDFLNNELQDYKDIHFFYSFNSGLKAIKDSAPDLVLLDMTLPTFDRRPNGREGRSRPLGGYDIMRKMRLFKINSKVIIVTQLESFGEGSEKVGFNELTDQCREEFPNLFIGSVYFDQSGSAWMEELRRILNISDIEL